MTGDARWTLILDRIALFLTLLGFLLREWTPGASAGPGLNLFIHLLFWIALTLWFAGRATSTGADYRFTGFEFAFLAFSIVALFSVQRASYRLAALDQAFTWLSLALFFVLCVQVVGRRLLLSLLLATLFTLALYALIQRLLLFPMIQPEAATSTVEMSRRIRTNEPFATFAGPNQLAGFLVLLLPVAFGSMMDHREFRWRAAAVGLGFLALVLTGSLGGWVALACGIATMAALFRTRTRGRALVVGIGAGAVAVALALLLWSPMLPAAGRRSHSMHVREVYWRASGPIIAKAPLLGVGLDNWQEHYFQTKSDVQQETKKAHNDYLQILAETGVAGFLAFAGILILGLRKVLVRASDPEPDRPDPPKGLVLAPLCVLVLLGVLQSADVVGTSMAIVLGAAWVGAWLLLGRSAAPADSTWTRIGLAGGLGGFMVHMVVDFQVYDPGVLAALVAVLALASLSRGGAAAVRIPKLVCAAATAVLLAITAPLLTAVTPRSMAADNEREEAQAALTAIDAGWAKNLSLAILDTVRLSESAQAHNPFHPDGYLLFARAKFREWQRLQRTGGRDAKAIEEAEGMVLQSLENAIRLRPLLSPLHEEKAHYSYLFHRYYLKSGKGAELSAAKAAEHLRVAIEEQRRAYDLYPTFSRNAYSLARYLEIARDPGAPLHFQEALRLSRLAGRELENLDRLKLEALPEARCLHAQGKPLEARDVLNRWLQKEVQGLGGQDAQDRIERLVRDNDDEMDALMTPVLKDVVQAILRDLK